MQAGTFCAKPAEQALSSESYTEETLRDVARLADGDVRIAIQTLRHAAYLAERENQGMIRPSHVERAWNSAKELKKTYVLRRLTDHHRLIYDLVVANPGIRSGDLWRTYLKACKRKKLKPIAVRTYSDYCNKLVDIGLIQAKRAAIQGKVREFSAAK